jgi:hypothetical protein
MTRLHGALLRALQPTPRHAGDVLDDGSIVRAQADDTEQGGFHLRLVHRPGAADDPDARRGHWTVRYGTMSGFVDSVLVAHPDFAVLYEMVHDHASDVLTREPARRGGWQWSQAEQMLRQFILDHYDPEDAEEAAERMLVALGSTPRTMPAALTQHLTVSKPENP